ncbi:MAG: glucuronate isomerase [Paracoccaceae bacterium]|nr:glucuronate isomerase [Paracoccaceae bacterium]
MSILTENRLLPTDPSTAKIALELFRLVENIPIISPHGHTEAHWFSENAAFENPTDLFVTPDHYVYRMLISHGIDPASIGLSSDGEIHLSETKREIWNVFASNYYLFQGTPTRLWLNFVFQNLFGLKVSLNAETAELYYNVIDEALKKPEFKPRALFEQFNIEVLSTTNSPLDNLEAHKNIINSDWAGRIIPAYRPDNVIDPDNENFTENIQKLGEITGENTEKFSGYLAAQFSRRNFFKSLGATSTDHGHPTANTENLSSSEVTKLFDKALTKNLSALESEKFRGHMLLEMARMSLEDNLVMQLHPGSFRNHSPKILSALGRDRGFDIPRRTDYVQALKPLLDEVGLDNRFSLILFTLDETALSRELAPLCGVYPCLKIGPPWWFFDSVEGMQRFRRAVTETAGFFNTVGFNDDTRAFCSIPARHDVARRVDCSYLAELVVSGQISEEEGEKLSYELTYGLAKKAYKL